ncbi:MAG: S1/P1 nuclease [Alistipes sp.]|nr:S1/P1 nuclease [Alistipes sp.]
MKRFIILLAALLIAGVNTECFAWGREGHATIAYIAERHLTPKAKENIEKCIDGHSIVYYASWLDNHRAEHKSWGKLSHVCHYDINTLRAIGKPRSYMKSTLKKLKNYRELPDSALKVTIYHFVHSFGDYHCPGHVALYDCTGEKPKKVHTSSYDIYLKTKKTVFDYHKLWDGGIIQQNHPDWGYMDWGHALDSSVPQEYIDSVTAGTWEDWLHDVATRTHKQYNIFEGVPKKDKGAAESELSVVDRQKMNEFGEFAAEQLLIGGLRMAKIINEIFGE